MTEREVCKRYIRVAFAETAPKAAIITRLRCKQWSCPACAKTNAWIWRNWLLTRLPEVSDTWWILTLTASPETRTLNASMDNLRTRIDAFFKRVKRVFGEIQYVRVYEKHPTSEAVHVHFVVCGLLPFVSVGASAKHRPMAIGCLRRTERAGVWSIRTWIKKTCGGMGMGYIADCTLISGEPTKAVWYVTKYLTKAQDDLHVKGLRHVQVTAGIGSPPKHEGDLEWTTVAYITARMFVPNTAIEDVNTGFIVDNDYWEHTGFYPDD